MIYSLTGELVYADTSMAAINVNGIAFQLDISLNTLQQLGPIGSTETLFTYMNFKQDGVDLIGFHDKAEKDAFQMLTGVSGVGPKAALAVLSEMDPARLTLAVAAGDYKAITRAKGVGPKVAQRIVLELKDKVAKNLDPGSASEAFFCWRPRRPDSTSPSTTPSRSSRAWWGTARPRRNRSWK